MTRRARSRAVVLGPSLRGRTASGPSGAAGDAGAGEATVGKMVDVAS